MTIGECTCQLTNGTSLANGVVLLANKPIGEWSVTGGVFSKRAVVSNLRVESHAYDYGYVALGACR